MLQDSRLDRVVEGSKTNRERETQLPPIISKMPEGHQYEEETVEGYLYEEETVEGYLYEEETVEGHLYEEETVEGHQYEEETVEALP